MVQAQRPRYSENQILQWLEYIGVADRITKEACDTQVGLEYLNRLICRQLFTVPFENLDLHYSLTHHISLDTDFLFEKIVGRKMGRGGYCMQNNHFFGTMLRSLGYQVLPVGGRVSSAAMGVTDPAQIWYTGWSHAINIVYVAGQKYMVDVGFGANSANAALPLVDGWTGHQTWNDAFDDMRLEWGFISDSTIRTEQQKLWMYQKRFDKEAPWLPMYCFTELEFLAQDYDVMSYRVSHSLSSFFTHKIMIHKAILDESGNIVGDMTMFERTVKSNKCGKREILAEAKTEAERVEALEKFFDIKLEPAEIKGINGYVSMIQ